MYTKIIIGDTTYTTGISSGSLYLHRMIVDTDFILGNPIANMFEVQMYNVSDVSGQSIEVIQYEGTNETPLFKGVIDSAKLDKGGYYRNIVAYDLFYSYRETNVALWWEGFWSTRVNATVKELRQSLLTYMSLTEVSGITLPNDDLTVTKNIALSLAYFGDMLRVICECQACFPNINASGVIEYIIPDNTTSSPSEPEYRGAESNFEDFTTPTYGAVKIYQDNVLYYSAGSGDAVVISDNFLLKNMSPTTLSSACQSIIDVVSKMSYTPCEIVMIESDTSYTLGQTFATTKGTHFVFSDVLKGIQFIEQTLSCSGEETSTDTPVISMSNVLLQNQISEVASSGEIKYYEYHNGNLYNISSGSRKRILKLTIASTKVTRTIVNIEINLTTTDTDSNGYTTVKAQYMIGSEFQVLEPTETYIDGSHVMHLMYVLSVQADTTTQFSVYLTANSGNIFIARGGIIAIASGTGIVGDGVWDGTFDLEDEVTSFAEPTIIFGDVTESVTITTDTPTSASISDEVTSFEEPIIIFGDADEDIRITYHNTAFERITEEGDTRLTEEGDSRMTEEEVT